MARMIVWTATVWVIIVFFAGCSQQQKPADLTTPNGQNSPWVKTEADRIANAPKAKTPEIHATTYFATGLLLENQGDLTGALDKYRKAIDEKPDYLTAYNRLGELQMKLRQYDQAEATYRKGLKHHPGNGSLLNNLAFVHLAQHRYDQAEAELNQALKIDPYFKRAHVNLGLVLAKQGKYDEALTHFRQGCPEFEANYNLAIILHAEGKRDLARTYYQTALQFNPAFEPAKKGLEQLAALPPTTQPTTRPATQPAPAVEVKE